MPLDLAKLKKSELRSAVQKKTWGGGMSCSGVAVKCTIVDQHHYGPIPGVEVGDTWSLRIDASSSGVHRPPVAGMSGGANGCQSIVLAGGYPEDQDDGDEFTYTGSGGRDLSGNKRTNVQSKDQVLTGCNLGLALTCNPRAKAYQTQGFEAIDWRSSKPVRVLRSSNFSKHSKYAPKLQPKLIRYDGIYRVVKYWPEKSAKSGYIVWRYLLRRDDPSPAPWTKEGQKIISDRQSLLQSHTSTAESGDTKRAKSDSMPQEAYKPADEVLRLISMDADRDKSLNARCWGEVRANQSLTFKAYIDTIVRVFECMICQDLVENTPVTTKCGHNFCQGCFVRCVKSSDIQSGDIPCPNCRSSIDRATPVNKVLAKILSLVFPFRK
eukprot:jgi/Hompol1/3341/HPOL_003203-RA